MRTLLLALHIASVAGWLGANYVQILLAPRFGRAGRDSAVTWARQSNWLGERYYPVIGALVLITGVLLVVETGWDWSDGFVGLGIAIVILGGITGVVGFGRLGKQRLDALEAGDTDAADAVLGRIVRLGVVDTALILLTVLAMVDKWGS